MKVFLDNAICVGRVNHRRVYPLTHNLSFNCWLTLVDLSSHSEVIFASKVLGFCLREKDYLNSSNGTNKPVLSLYDKICELVAQRLGYDFGGKIFLLANMRQWHFCFNPVSFYFCVDDGKLAAIIAEITNTPWSEKHYYVFDTREQGVNGIYTFCFPKEFHVSPFNPMSMAYEWRFIFRRENISIFMRLRENQTKVFDASLRLKIFSYSKRSLLKNLIFRPFQCHRLMLNIYWNALVLYMRGATFYPHPRKKQQLP